MTSPTLVPINPGPLAVPQPWDLVATGYAEQAVNVMLPFSREAVRLAAPPSSARIVDVAAGCGTLTLEIAPAVDRVDAVDFSDRMLEELEERRVALGMNNVYAQKADGQALPFEAGTFDAGFSMFGLMFFPDRSKGFGELLRVLRPGGVAVVSSWAPVEMSPLMQLMFGALRAADPDRAAPKTNLLSLENPDLFESEMSAAGFRDVTIRAFTYAIPVENGERYWQSMVRASAPLAVLRERLGPDEWARQARLAEQYVASEVTGPCSLGATAYLGIGWK